MLHPNSNPQRSGPGEWQMVSRKRKVSKVSALIWGPQPSLHLVALNLALDDVGCAVLVEGAARWERDHVRVALREGVVNKILAIGLGAINQKLRASYGWRCCLDGAGHVGDTSRSVRSYFSVVAPASLVPHDCTPSTSGGYPMCTPAVISGAIPPTLTHANRYDCLVDQPESTAQADTTREVAAVIGLPSG
jgi:hypothetical protein